MIKLVIFDLDDTLISENEYIKSGFSEVSEYISKKYSKNHAEVFDELMQLFNEDSKMVFNRYLAKNSIENKETEVTELIKIYREHFPKIQLYDDAREILVALKKKNIKIALLSDGHKVTQKNKLKSLNIEELFDYIDLTDELGREFWKPNPKGFEVIKESLNIPFEETIYVGDNPKKDFYISKIYPIRTIRIKRSGTVYHDAEYFEGIKENKEVQSLREILNLIENDEF